MNSISFSTGAPAMSKSDHAAFGRAGEEWAVTKLNEIGASERIPYQAEGKVGNATSDILVERTCLGVTARICIEVKSATRTRRKRGGNSYRWQFSLKRHGLPLDEEIFLFLCYGDDLKAPERVYVIPGILIKDLTKLDVPATPGKQYRGRWEKNLDAWHQISLALWDAHENTARPEWNADDIPF